MRILIAYYSETGNTAKIGQTIHEEVSQDHEAEIKRIQDLAISSLKDFQLVFLGAPCHDADLAKPVKRFLDRLPRKPQFKLAGFFTHATYFPGDTARTREIFQEWAGRCVPPLNLPPKTNSLSSSATSIAKLLLPHPLKPLSDAKSSPLTRNGTSTFQTFVNGPTPTIFQETRRSPKKF